jgi:uncharacterized protein involved in outer membrane biogenesis
MARPPPPRTAARRRGRLLRLIALVAGGIIVLAVASIAVFVATFDPNSRKAQIIAAVQAATGRELTIGGHISLSISLQPTLEMSDVSLANPPGFSRPQMATLQTLQLQIELIPLLSRDIRIVQLVLRKPNILLETNAKGQSNWELSAAGGPVARPTPQAGNAAATRPPSIALSSVKIEGGTLAMRDAGGRTTTLALQQLAATGTSASAKLHLTMAATYNGAPVSLTADTGPLAGLLGDGGAPWPVKLAITAAGAKLTAEGTLAQPVALRGLAIGVSADIPDLAALVPLAGTALPKLKTVTAQFKLADTNGGDSIAITDLKLTLPNTDLAGSVSVVRGARPLVTANLSATRIDIDALKPTLPAGDQAASGQPAASPAPASRSSATFSDGKLPFGVLRLGDADVQLAVGDLRTGGLDYKSIKLHAVAKDGRLSLDPFTFDAPGDAPGRQVDVKATVDTGPATPTVSLTLRAPGLALQPLFQALGKPGYANGSLELRADLRGAGDTPHAIAASLDGPIGAAVAKGEIDSALLGGLMGALLQRTDLTKLGRMNGMSALNCFAMRIDAAHGVGTLRALRLDTSTLNMDGSGTMNFGTEALDLRLRPMAGIAGTTITAPVIVKGSFADPVVEADPLGAVTGNVGNAAKLALGASTGGIALIIGSAVEQKLSGDACAAPLALARFAQPPAVTAPPSGAPSQKPAKPDNTVNTLKKLFQ